jgi:hypothetical protein
MNNKFRSFEDARIFARTINLKSQKDWRNYCNKEKKPQDIPTDPGTTYKNKGWVNYGDFLGTNRTATRKIEFLSFENARNFVRSLNLKNTKEFREYVKSVDKNVGIPTNPNVVYKKEWMGFGNFIINDRVEHVYPVVNEILYNSKISSRTHCFKECFITHYFKKQNIIYKLYYPDKTVYMIEKILTGLTNTGPNIKFNYGS